jgi:hypothetical protein
MHGNIVNVPTNFNLMQKILPRMPYDDSSIAEFLKRKLEYKSIYMLGYICPNIVMKALQFFCEIPLYVHANVSIKSNWQGLVELANANENTQYKKLLKLLILIILKHLKKLWKRIIHIH